MYFLFNQTPFKFLVDYLWRDEAFSYLLAKRSIVEILFLTARDFNPPLYYIILHYWQQSVGHTEVMLRILSFIFFAFGIYVFDHILGDMFKFKFQRRIAYLLLFTFNPLLVYYAFEARMYSMFMCLAMISFYAFFLKKKKMYFVATLLGLYTHYFMFLVLASQVFAVLVTGRKDVKSRINNILSPVVCTIPWFIFVLIQKPLGTERFWIEPIMLKQLVEMPGMLYTGYERSWGFSPLTYFGMVTLLLRFTALFALFIGFGYWLTKKKLRDYDMWLFIYILCWAFIGPLIIFILSFVKPLYIPRYLIFATPAYILILAFAIEKMRLIFRLVALLLIALMTWGCVAAEVAYLHKRYPAEKIIEIRRQLRANDFVYVTNELDYFVAQYYLGEKKVYIYAKDYQEIPLYVGKVLIPKSSISSTLPYYPARTFILEKNGTYEINSLY